MAAADADTRMIGQFAGCILALFWVVLAMFLGALLFGAWGIILGTALAVWLLNRSGRGLLEDGGLPGLAQRQQTFLRISFMTAGHVAQADGQVTSEEVELARRVMEQFGMGIEARGTAMRHFESGVPGI